MSSKTMPDFSNDEEDDDFETQLNQSKPNMEDHVEDYGFDDRLDDDDEDELRKLKEAADEIDAEAERLKEIQSALAIAKNPNGSSAAGSGPVVVDSGDEDMGDTGVVATEPSAKEGSVEVGSASPPKKAESETGSQWPANEADERSIFVKNVDYSSEANEINSYFSSCGAIERLTILTDKLTGRPKGCAYIQFKTKEAVETALSLDGSTFKDRVLSVQKKHTTVPPYRLWRRRRRRRRRYNYYNYGYAPYYPRRRRRSWQPY